MTVITARIELSLLDSLISFIIAYFFRKEKGFFQFFSNRVKIHKKFSNHILTLVILDVTIETDKIYKLQKGCISMKKKLLVSGLLACCMAVFPMLHTAAAASAVNLHDSALMSDEEKMIKEYCDIAVNLVNNERVFERGLPEVATFPLLNEVTCIRAEELNQEFGHYRPDGSLCFSILKQEGIKYSGVAENIAAGRTDPVSTVDQWMNSKGHRDNIINPAYTHLGIGYYHAPDTTYYWSMFLISSMKGKEAAVVDSQYIPERWLGDPDGSHETIAADAKWVSNMRQAVRPVLKSMYLRAFWKPLMSIRTER